MSQELKHEDSNLLESASQRRKDVLLGKRLTLMKALLKDSKQEDVNLIEDIVNGFDLTGPLPVANVFKKKFRPATIPCQELRKIAGVCRRAMMSTVASSGDPDLDAGLMKQHVRK